MSACEMGTKSCHCCFWACFQRTWPQTSPGCVPKDPHHPPQPGLCWYCRGFTFEPKKHCGEEWVCPGAHKAGLWAAPGHLSWFLFAVLMKAGKHQLHLLGLNSVRGKIQELCKCHPKGCSPWSHHPAGKGYPVPSPWGHHCHELPKQHRGVWGWISAPAVPDPWSCCNYQGKPWHLHEHLRCCASTSFGWCIIVISWGKTSPQNLRQSFLKDLMYSHFGNCCIWYIWIASSKK